MTKSPFPGMDPYLEAKWPEVHTRLIVYATNAINPQLPRDLQASIEENLSVRSDDAVVKGIRPDINIVDDFSGSGSTATAVMEQVAIASKPIAIPRAPHPERHIEIVANDGRLITSIEFVSPWNKIGSRAREQYSRKQADLMAAGVNLVEIDLVREGKYVLTAMLAEIPPQHRKSFLTCVYRDIKYDQFELYATTLKEPLPTISIPLRPSDKDILLPIQRLIDTCYVDGRYDRINYQQPPYPALDDEQTAWADSLLRTTGLRS